MMQGLALRAGGVVGDLAGLDDDGALLLRDGAGRIHRIRSGDVAIVS
jgi:biotin-(acetyl-CoA carboxylase) ligase